ncbi:MAG: hypothetical protein U5R48_02070 [Gammaproteobacteria bacterium]|nr:hypothetical protein [Gammaproteobacteria bacterium]
MKLVEFIRRWFDRYFVHEEALLLVILIAAGLVVVDWLGRVLAPALTSLIIAFILQGVVARLLELAGPGAARRSGWRSCCSCRSSRCCCWWCSR